MSLLVIFVVIAVIGYFIVEGIASLVYYPIVWAHFLLLPLYVLGALYVYMHVNYLFEGYKEYMHRIVPQEQTKVLSDVENVPGEALPDRHPEPWSQYRNVPYIEQHNVGPEQCTIVFGQLQCKYGDDIF